jgi:hypothetical protein
MSIKKHTITFSFPKYFGSLDAVYTGGPRDVIYMAFIKNENILVFRPLALALIKIKIRNILHNKLLINKIYYICQS